MSRRLTAADARHIAALARLELSDAEVDLFTDQLSAILEYAASLNGVRVEADDERAAPEPDAGSGPLRQDVPQPCLPARTVLEAAAGADPGAGFFTVPRVLKP